ncbi:MAG TPA: hypothetical protein PKC80_03430 [Burkholderiaceae bacterium]|nr:hypothetical protein [Burkholderiaceae bacterium]
MTNSQNQKKAHKKPTFHSRLYAATMQGRLTGAIKKRIKPRLIRIGQTAMKTPIGKRFFTWLLSFSPRLQSRVHRVLWSELQLSTRAFGIFENLKKAVEEHPASK